MNVQSKLETISKIKQLIANDELEESIELIKKMIEINEHINFLVLQSARYKDLKSAINLNIIDWSNALLEKSKIRKGLLDFIDDLNADLYQEQVYFRENKNRIESADDLLSFTPKDINPSLETDLDEIFKISLTKLEKEIDFDIIGFEAPASFVNRKYFPKKVSTELDKTDNKLVEFLTEFKQWYFSAARIIRWGSNQNGYEEFCNLDIKNVEDRLSKLYHRSLLVRVQPKEGYKIYRIKEIDS